jgi:hypothetical protein
MKNPRATTSLKPGGCDVNIAKYLSQMNFGHHCRKWKSPILGVAQIVLRDAFLASIFLVYVEPKVLFRYRAGKFSSAAPNVEKWDQLVRRHATVVHTYINTKAKMGG